MPIPFTCPHCGVEVTVSDEYAGRSGPCASCGQPITIPGLAGQNMAGPFSHGQAGAATIAARPRSSGAPWVLVLVIVLGVMFVGGGIMVALLLPAVSSIREPARRCWCINNTDNAERRTGIILY